MLKQIGLYMIIFGVFSMILAPTGVNFRILMWVDSWGLVIGWAIRIGLVLVGIALRKWGDELFQDDSMSSRYLY